MIDPVIAEYISKNKLCSDYLFNDWSEFLDIVYTNSGTVNAILWFEYVLITKQKDSMGGGGYRDLNHPEYMFAETMLYDDGLGNLSKEEIRAHIISTIQSYPNNRLIPSFYINEED